jgi:uncharacterized membrane protein
VIDEFCSQDAEDMNKYFNTVTITLIVVGVLLVCAVGGGVIWVSVVKGRGDRTKTPEYGIIYAPRASYVSIHSMQQ